MKEKEINEAAENEARDENEKSVEEVATDVVEGNENQETSPVLTEVSAENNEEGSENAPEEEKGKKGKKDKKKKEKKKRRFPIWARVICIILGVLLALFVGLVIFIDLKLSKINKYDPETFETIPPEEEVFETDPYTEGAEVIKPDDVIWSDDVNTLSQEGVMNILLVGQDTRQEGQTGRSDSIMILTVDKTNKKLKVTSLMRDMYVQIPGYSDNRINVAYQFGGYELLKATIEKNFGISVDCFVEVDFFAFKKVVDILGGVYLDLNAEEAAVLKGWGHRTVVGRNRLDGEAALSYCTLRYVGNSDYERTERQRRTLASIYDRLKETGTITTILEFIDEIFPLVTTNMSNGEIVTLAIELFSLNISHVDQYRLPVDGTFTPAYVNGMAVLIPDLEANRQYLWEIIYGKKSSSR